MFAAVATGAFLMLIATLSVLAGNAWQMREASREREAERAVEHVIDAVAQFHLAYRALPPSLAVLAQQPGREYLRAYVAHANGGSFPGQLDFVQVFCTGFIPPVGHPQHDPRGLCRDSSITGTFDDGTQRYARALAVVPLGAQRHLGAWLADNQCGSGSAVGATPAQVWCGGLGARYAIYRTNQARMAMINPVRQSLSTTADKFAMARAAGMTFPATPTGAVPLRSLVTAFSGSPGTSAATCWGSFQLVSMRMALDCADLYTAYGEIVLYERLSPSQIRLRATTPVTLSDGTLLATEVIRG
jgi:hypothetical protein